jgi:hypothetical protein
MTDNLTREQYRAQRELAQTTDAQLVRRALDDGIDPVVLARDQHRRISEYYESQGFPPFPPRPRAVPRPERGVWMAVAIVALLLAVVVGLGLTVWGWVT